LTKQDNQIAIITTYCEMKYSVWHESWSAVVRGEGYNEFTVPSYKSINEMYIHLKKKMHSRVSQIENEQ